MDAEEKFWTAKVIAEISAADVMQLASEVGMPVTPAEAADLLNNELRSRGMRNHMLAAGRDYLAASLESRRQRAWWDRSCGKGENKNVRFDA